MIVRPQRYAPVRLPFDRIAALNPFFHAGDPRRKFFIGNVTGRHYGPVWSSEPVNPLAEERLGIGKRRPIDDGAALFLITRADLFGACGRELGEGVHPLAEDAI